MKRFFVLMIFLPFVIANAVAQDVHSVYGLALDRDEGEGIPMAAVQILSLPDSARTTSATYRHQARVIRNTTPSTSISWCISFTV